LLGIEEAIEGGAADAEHAGRANLVAVSACEDEGDVAEDRAVEVGIFGEGIGGDVRRRSGGWGGPVEAGDIERADPLAGALEGGGRDDGFELADVARPGPGGKADESAWGKTTEGFCVLEAPLTEEQTGEEGEIVAAVAQGREIEANGGEMAGEIGAKRTGGSQTAQGLRSTFVATVPLHPTAKP
jgi:hypothetical protein